MRAIDRVRGQPSSLPACTIAYLLSIEMKFPWRDLRTRLCLPPSPANQPFPFFTNVHVTFLLQTGVEPSSSIQTHVGSTGGIVWDQQCIHTCTKASVLADGHRNTRSNMCRMKAVLLVLAIVVVLAGAEESLASSNQAEKMRVLYRGGSNEGPIHGASMTMLVHSLAGILLGLKCLLV